MTRRFVTTNGSDFSALRIGRAPHRLAACEDSDAWFLNSRSGQTTLYPVTEAELREHRRMSLRRILATFAVVSAIVMLILLASILSR